MERVIYLACFMALALAAPPKDTEIAGLTDFKPVTALPATISTCSEKDSNINECIRASFQSMTRRMKEGFPELNIPPMDPFLVERSNLDFSNGLIEGRVRVKNMRIFGMSDATVEKVNYEMKDGKVALEMVSHLPRLYLEGNYKADVKINELKLTPKGYFNATMTDLTMKSKSEGELYEKDGHTHLRVKKFEFDPDLGNLEMYASGLFPDESLNAAALSFMNQYWRDFYKTMIPQTRSTWEPMLLNTLNAFLEAVPFDLFITKN